MKISVEGADPHTARTVVVLLHGGGARALDFLALSQEFPAHDDLCWLAPQALQSVWFPAPPGESRALQEPHFTVSVESVMGLLDRHTEQRLVLAGFRDGAGVVAELLTRSDLPMSVKAAWIAWGGLVGPPTEWPDRPRLSLPVLLSGVEEEIEESARYLREAGARVTLHRYDAGPARIDDAELGRAGQLLTEAMR